MPLALPLGQSPYSSLGIPQQVGALALSATSPMTNDTECILLYQNAEQTFTV
jgi:hypothetical protein